MICQYRIAEQTIRINGNRAELEELGLKGFAPFREVVGGDKPTLEITTDNYINISDIKYKLLTSFHFEEGQAECHFGEIEGGYIFMIENATQESVLFLYDSSQHSVKANYGILNEPDKSFVRFGVWFVACIAMAEHLTTAIHSSVIVCRGKALMFLGESGTGKSTHTRLWRENIEGATLLNDDSPFIACEKQVRVYGSPWSGKTPCYKNEEYPIAAIVRLSQAPCNRVTRLKGVKAIGAVLPSLPPAFAYDKHLENKMVETLSCLLSGVAVYHLECLPNAEAAQLVYDTVLGDE